MAQTPLLWPGSLRGFASALAPSALPKGIVAALYDLRLDDGTARVRPGGVTVKNPVSGALVYRGSFECVQNGVKSLFVALSDGSKVSILRSIDHGATWTAITTTTPDNRLSDVGPVYFAIASSYSTDYVVVQNGVDAPRVYNTALSVAPNPLAGSPTGSVNMSGYYEFYFDGTPTFTNVANHITGSIGTKNGDTYLTVKVFPAVDSSDMMVVQSPNTSGYVRFAAGRRVGFLIDGGTAHRDDWRNLKIEASVNGSTYYTLYDPSKTAAVEVDATGTAAFVIVPDIPALDGQNARYLRFRYFGDPPSATFSFMLLGVFVEGTVPGGTTYGAAYDSLRTSVEGPGAILATPTYTTVCGVSLPPTPLFGFVGGVTIVSGATFTSAEYDSVSVYRMPPGANGYYYAFGTLVAPSSTTTVYDYSAQVDYSRAMPNAASLTIPVGTAMASINDRLFVCAGNRLYYSQATRPFVFSLLVNFDADGNPISTSAGSYGKPGETFQAVIGVGQVLTGSQTQGTPQGGAVNLYGITDRTTYVGSGFDAASLNKTTAICVGTRSPLSVSPGASGGFTMLDSLNQVRRVEGTASVALSKRTVDDQTAGIPNARLRWADGATIDDRYYLAYTPQGETSNTRVLVFNDTSGAFETIDRPETAAQGLLAYYDPTLSRTRLLRFSDLGLFEHAAPGASTEPSGASIAASIVFPEIGFGTSAVKLRGGEFVSDVDATGTATLSVLCTTGTRIGGLAYNAVSLAPKATETRRAARFATNVGADTLTAQPTLTLTAKGGTRLYHFSIEADKGTDAVTP